MSKKEEFQVSETFGAFFYQGWNRLVRTIVPEDLGFSCMPPQMGTRYTHVKSNTIHETTE